ncbi:MAG TPA: tetratricopeptide repeat protein [Terriglobales bacterium]|jgi:predicted negative regulator of RcsB-dependent stress response|nr:tetratricopeptide repeat protein [Terriglobales bacterium]
MRATLADPSLARYAGRFVWLTLDYDKPENGAFLTQHGVLGTPSFFVINPATGAATATEPDAMTLQEMIGFLERGESGMKDKSRTPVDAALTRGDELLARNQPAAAAKAYSEALRLAPKTGPAHEQAVDSLMTAWYGAEQWKSCAEMAVAEAPHMSRNAMFGRVVLTGLDCVDQAESEAWAAATRKSLDAFAVEAIGLNTTVRDHRFELYRELMREARSGGDQVPVQKWGNQWLAELDATKPVNDDERSALDIARVDAAKLMGDPSRVLPALIASEKAMPGNYNASLRLAQMEVEAKRYEDAIAACDRGLPHVTGPVGRAWLMQVKADALTKSGKRADAHRVLEEALTVAQQIGSSQVRDAYVQRITAALKETA